MHKLVEELAELTQHAVSRLDELSYEELEQFVDRRESIVVEIRQLPPEQFQQVEDRQIIQELLSYDPLILEKMNTLMTDASNQLNKAGNARLQRGAYDAGYTPDSVFFDRKK